MEYIDWKDRGGDKKPPIDRVQLVDPNGDYLFVMIFLNIIMKWMLSYYTSLKIEMQKEHFIFKWKS